MPTKTRGAKYRAEVLAANDLRPDEKLILDEIAAVIDELDGLPKANVVERRQQRNLLSRLLGQLPLTEAPDKPPMTGKSLRAQAAANARWRRSS
jgi:hypothetical protein